MRTRHLARGLACAAIAHLASLLLAASALADRVEKSLELLGGTRVVYQIITPDNFVPGSTAPVLLVLPPGKQDANMVNAGLARLDPECRRQGWVVVSPQAPGGRLFFQGGEEVLPALLQELRKTVAPEGGKVHLLGSSNGGLSALRFAIRNPESVRSLMLMPGGFASKADAARVNRLKGIPVRLYVGSDDTVEWTDGARAVLSAGEKAGLDIALDVRPANGHTIDGLTGEEIMRVLDGFRTIEGTLSGPRGEVASVLDALHKAAAEADFEAYFALFAPDAVFLGTDASERWTVEQFKVYARPVFEKNKGKPGGAWTYTPRQRHVDLLPDAKAAWFDELLDHAKYGECRGTGILRKAGPKWVICQYHLTVPVPNALMDRVAKLIKAEREKAK
ncbi:MAG: nuclear transport factor 2 family protein [Phycisphaerae bacterium]|nr:nuclear transport factor 2 family protein [Phycisphaerae bacterium]